jgi:hypothetical protein
MAIDIGRGYIRAGTKLAIPQVKVNRDIVCGAMIPLKQIESTKLDGLPVKSEVIEEKDHERASDRASQERFGATAAEEHG